jgi:putative zinc finger/helix-turn-helix YgiT family protein
MVNRSPTKHPVLSDDACPSCGTLMQQKTAELGFVVNGENITVPDAPHLACPSCDEIVLRYEDSKALQERAIEAYRQKHSLFSADEIRARRQRLGLTQAQFADLLQLGLNTVSRWEAGRNVQNGAMDVLLRLVRDVPETLDYLKRHAA